MDTTENEGTEAPLAEETTSNGTAPGDIAQSEPELPLSEDGESGDEAPNEENGEDDDGDDPDDDEDETLSEDEGVAV